MSESYHLTDDRLEGFVERSLPDGDRAVVESHLLACPSCQARVEEWEALFAALAGLPQMEPTPDFANRVMAHVHIAPHGAYARRAAWQPRMLWEEWSGQVGALVARVTPQTNYGWSIAVMLLAVPFLVGGGAIAWLISNSDVTSGMLLMYTRDTLAEGMQAFGSVAISAIMQTDIAAWVVASLGTFINTAGLTGVGAVMALTGATIVGSAWVLYRNLFRSPSRESDYALFSF